MSALQITYLALFLSTASATCAFLVGYGHGYRDGAK